MDDNVTATGPYTRRNPRGGFTRVRGYLSRRKAADTPTVAPETAAKAKADAASLRDLFGADNPPPRTDITAEVFGERTEGYGATVETRNWVADGSVPTVGLGRFRRLDPDKPIGEYVVEINGRPTKMVVTPIDQRRVGFCLEVDITDHRGRDLTVEAEGLVDTADGGDDVTYRSGVWHKRVHLGDEPIETTETSEVLRRIVGATIARWRTDPDSEWLRDPYAAAEKATAAH